MTRQEAFKAALDDVDTLRAMVNEHGPEGAADLARAIGFTEAQDTAPDGCPWALDDDAAPHENPVYYR